MADTHALDVLIQSLRRLPGVGVKSAQRMAFHLLQHDRDGAQALSRALQAAVGSVQHCERCHTFTGAYQGLYFVLMGKLSPLDGIGPHDIGLKKLFDRALDGEVEEVILATNFTAEGEATAHVISEALKARGLRLTRLARGVPAGSELEYVDLGTIAHALVDRR